MASGKTTFGRAAAKKIGWRFVDLDEVIAARYGTPAEIFATKGEQAFRDIETETLREALQSEEDTVLALGGGTVLRDENLQLIKKKARLIWLDTLLSLWRSASSSSSSPIRLSISASLFAVSFSWNALTSSSVLFAPSENTLPSLA